MGREWDGDPEDDEERKCRHCKRRFRIKRWEKARHCPYCGAAQKHGAEEEPDERDRRPVGGRRDRRR